MSDVDNDQGTGDDGGNDGGGDSGTTRVLTDDNQLQVVGTQTETDPAAAPATGPVTNPAQPTLTPEQRVLSTDIPEGTIILKSDMLIEELEDVEFIRVSGRQYLLPGAPDGSHTMSDRQMATTASYVIATYPAGSKLGDVVGPYEPTARVRDTLRAKFLRGLQKDWNIVSGITGESRALTAREPITERQLTMMYDAIVPALVGTKGHWDPIIQSGIQKMPASTRELFLNMAIEAKNRGDVSGFMTRFEAVVGRPQRQMPEGAAQPTGIQAIVRGAGAPTSMRGDEEPF